MARRIPTCAALLLSAAAQSASALAADPTPPAPAGAAPVTPAAPAPTPVPSAAPAPSATTPVAGYPLAPVAAPGGEAATPAPAETPPSTEPATPPQAAPPAPPPAPGPQVAIPAPRPPETGPAVAIVTVAKPDPAKVRFALEFGAGLTGTGRFPSDEADRNNEEAIDGTLNLGAFLGTRSQLYGLVLERTWMGRDHYGAVSAPTTITASYAVDTLWLSGRWYFSDERPAIYAGAAIGPAIPRVRATGTQQSSDASVAPPVPFECSDAGRVGLGLAGVIGAEFDMADAWSFLADARVAGHVLSTSSDEFGRCAPAAGSALSGTLRLGVQFRFGS